MQFPTGVRHFFAAIRIEFPQTARRANFIIEVFSPSKEVHGREFDDKRANYAKAKIPEYWSSIPKRRRSPS